jgi:hypothetical protein
MIKLVLCGLTAISVSAMNIHGFTQTRQHIEIPIGQKAFDPQQQARTTMEFPGLRATFENGAPVTLRLESAGPVKTIKLPSELAQVSSAQLYMQRWLVISGMINGDVNLMVVVDVLEGSVADSFPCYSPTISPDGRYVAFVKFYPAHGVSSVEDHYMLYDVSLGASGNRPRIARRDPAVVGHVVFPKGVGNEAGDNVDLSRTPLHRMASDAFYWKPDSKAFVFADQIGELYSVILSSTVEGLPTIVSEIPSDLICKTNSADCWERLRSVRYPIEENTPIILTFQGYNGTPDRPIHLALLKTSVDTAVVSLLSVQKPQ